MATAERVVGAARPRAVTVSKWRLTRRERHNLMMGLLFISPWIVGFCVFLVYPIFYTIRMSFTQYTGFGDAKWVGLANYHRMIHDDYFWKAVYNTIYYTVLAVPIGIVIAMVLALAMNTKVPEVPIYRTIYYLPSVVPLFSLAFVYRILMNPSQGIFDQIIRVVGLPSIN